MKVEWLGDGSLSAKASDLVEFDMASIRQVIAGARGGEPDVWVVSTPDYESGGRVLRDSPHTRLVAYTAADHTNYFFDIQPAQEASTLLPGTGTARRWTPTPPSPACPGRCWNG